MPEIFDLDHQRNVSWPAQEAAFQGDRLEKQGPGKRAETHELWRRAAQLYAKDAEGLAVGTARADRKPWPGVAAIMARSACALWWRVGDYSELLAFYAGFRVAWPKAAQYMDANERERQMLDEFLFDAHYGVRNEALMRGEDLDD